MVAETLEKNSTAQKGDLQRLDVYIDAVFVPCPCSQTVRDDGCEYTVEVKKEEDRPTIFSYAADLQLTSTHKIPQTANSTRKTLRTVRDRSENQFMINYQLKSSPALKGAPVSPPLLLILELNNQMLSRLAAHGA